MRTVPLWLVFVVLALATGATVLLYRSHLRQQALRARVEATREALQKTQQKLARVQQQWARAQREDQRRVEAVHEKLDRALEQSRRGEITREEYLRLREDLLRQLKQGRLISPKIKAGDFWTPEQLDRLFRRNADQPQR